MKDQCENTLQTTFGLLFQIACYLILWLEKSCHFDFWLYPSWKQQFCQMTQWHRHIIWQEEVNIFYICRTIWVLWIKLISLWWVWCFKPPTLSYPQQSRRGSFSQVLPTRLQALLPIIPCICCHPSVYFMLGLVIFEYC